MKKATFLILTAVLAAVCGKARAWEDDTAENTQITPTGLNYYETDVKTNADGVTFVFILGAGSPPSMRLQIVSPEGERLLARGGEVISQEANNSWFGFNQYVELDSRGDAFIGVEDWRTAPDGGLSTYAIYKYTAQGTKVLDGALLNGGKGHRLSSGLAMQATDDGGVVCAFNYTVEEDNADYVTAEKLDAEGRSVWTATLYKTDAFSNPLPWLTDAGDGRTAVFIATGGQVKMQIMRADGSTELAQPKTVYTGGMASAKAWEVFDVEELPGHKAMLSVVDGSKQGRLMVVGPDGGILLDGSDKGVLLNADYAYASDKPAVTYNAADDTYTCAYKIMDRYEQSLSQVMLQKVNGADGSAAWAEPKVLLPFSDASWYGYTLARSAGGGNTAVFFMEMNTTDYNDVKAYMQTVDSEGCTVGSRTAFATSHATKQTLRVSQLTGGRFIAAWDEERTGQNSLFMQAVTPQGGTSVTQPETYGDGECSRKEYFTPDGMKIQSPQRGLNIVRSTAGGRVTTHKFIKR